MTSVAGAPRTLPTASATLPGLLAYTEALGLERYLRRPKRGVASLTLALLWLVLAWRGSDRPAHLPRLDDPLLAALLGEERLPSARTLQRSLPHFPARALRAAVEASYRAELRRRSVRVLAAVDAHQLASWGLCQRAHASGLVRWA